MKTSRGVIPLVAAILGVIALAWAFVTGISAALSGGGSGALPYEIVFIVAAVVVLVALILAVINLIQGRSRVLAVITIIVTLAPIITVVVLRFSAVQ